MNQSNYPPSPQNIPNELTQASASYKRQAMLAMLGLAIFMILFISLAACFTYIATSSFSSLAAEFNLYNLIVGVVSAVLALFMIKSLFAIRKTQDPDGLEVTAQDEPKLFQFLNTLADEIGAPRPHRVFLTPQVNAAVFYDLSLLNLFFPSKKNLIVGMGLVNSLNLGELKAVLAHEFGHFAQGSMLVGRWVYIAQQIIVHMVATRDWLDKGVSLLGRFDIRVAWIGWILAIVIWSIRSVVDTLFRVIIIAERALSREMEFNADLVAVSVSGSDALVNALHKLQAADQAWQTASDVVHQNLQNKKQIEDVFAAQNEAISVLSGILGDSSFGQSPILPEAESDEAMSERSNFRVFDEDSARPPQMWATHPANRDREDNAKAYYVYVPIDESSAWNVFDDAEKTKKNVNVQFFRVEKDETLECVEPEEAVKNRFSQPWYSPDYKGTYLGRSWERSFASISELETACELKSSATESLKNIYPDSLKSDLELARNLEIERQTLEGLASGDLKPSGGIIRHRGEELKRNEIPEAIDEISTEYKEVAARLKTHDAYCRNAHLQAAKELGNGWEEHLIGLIALSHCTEHLKAHVINELSLLSNTWQVITADGTVGYFEKKRLLTVCEQVKRVMDNVASNMQRLVLTSEMMTNFNIESWQEVSPKFDLPAASKSNWDQWCPAASDHMHNILNVLSIINDMALADLIQSERKIKQHIEDGTPLEQAPQAGSAPEDYPVLLAGEEHVLQRKLDLWNRFQLAHGIMPTLARLSVSVGIVGGTIVFGMLSAF